MGERAICNSSSVLFVGFGAVLIAGTREPARTADATPTRFRGAAAGGPQYDPAVRVERLVLRWVVLALAYIGLVLMHSVVIADLHGSHLSEPGRPEATAAAAAAHRLPGANHASHRQAAAVEGVGGGSSHRHDAPVGHMAMMCLAVLAASVAIVARRLVGPPLAAVYEDPMQCRRVTELGTLGIPPPPRLRLCILRC